MKIRTLSLLAALLLLAAIINLPIGYYTFMRIAVTSIAVYLAHLEAQREQKYWLATYVVTAILFNPLIPIYLRNRGAWMLIDILFAILFITSSFRNLETKQHEK